MLSIAVPSRKSILWATPAFRMTGAPISNHSLLKSSAITCDLPQQFSTSGQGAKTIYRSASLSFQKISNGANIILRAIWASIRSSSPCPCICEEHWGSPKWCRGVPFLPCHLEAGQGRCREGSSQCKLPPRWCSLHWWAWEVTSKTDPHQATWPSCSYIQQQP